MKAKTIVVLISIILSISSGAAFAEEAGESRISVERVEERLGEEPTLQEVRRAVLRHFRLTPDILERIRDQTRSKAAAPYVIMSSSYRGTRSDRRLEDPPEQAVVDSTDRFQGDDSTSHLTLAWNFPDAVFTPTELQTYPLAEMQRNIMRSINRMYFYRRQLLLLLLADPPRDDRARTALRIRIEGYTALLNAYTGGWFSEQLPEGSL